MCGVGTTLVEAVHQGRDAIGIEYEPEWAEHAHANAALAKRHGATGHGKAVCGDGRSIASLIDPVVHGHVALVLTSPPYGSSLHGRVTAVPGGGVQKAHDRYSKDPANLAYVGLAGLLDAMHTLLGGAAQILRPGGIVAMAVRPWWHHGQLIDLPGVLADVGEQASQMHPPTADDIDALRRQTPRRDRTRQRTTTQSHRPSLRPAPHRRRTRRHPDQPLHQRAALPLDMPGDKGEAPTDGQRFAL